MNKDTPTPPPSDEEIEKLTVRFRLLPRKFEPVPDFVRLRAELQGASIARPIAEVLKSAKNGDDEALRELAYRVQRLCYELSTFSSERIAPLQARMDYWPELTRQHKKGRGSDASGLWNQYALNALCTLREAHLTTLELLKCIDDHWHLASGATAPLADSRKMKGWSKYPIGGGRVVRIANWCLMTCQLSLWPIEKWEVTHLWDAGELAIREFWETDKEARAEAFYKVRAAVTASGKVTPGRLRDAALKEIERAFLRVLARQMKDTERAIGAE